MKKPLGSAYAGFSRNVINSEVNREMSASVRSMFYLGIAMLMILIGAAFFLFVPLRRELTKEDETAQLAYVKPPEPKGTEITDAVDVSDGAGSQQASLLNPYKEEITRTQVTVLFAGIKGFKAYTETRDPQQVLDDLNQYLSVAAGCIVEFGGYIDKFIGDAVIAVFGNTPVWTDHSERAVSAACAIQGALQEAADNGNPLLSKVGIGISSGVVLSGQHRPRGEKSVYIYRREFQSRLLAQRDGGPGRDHHE